MWKKVKLGDLLSIARGGSPRPIQSFLTDDAEGVNWIKISDASASNKYIFKTKERIKKEGVSRSRHVVEGDFLLSNSMSFGRPYIMKTSGCIHDGWLVLSDYQHAVDANFLYYLLSSDLVKNQFESSARGSTVRNLNIDLVSNVYISYPPLAEQQRIVEKLDKAFEEIDRAIAATERKQEEVRSLLIEILRSKFTKNSSTEKKLFSDICILQRGYDLPTKERKVGIYPLYSANGITD